MADKYDEMVSQDSSAQWHHVSVDGRVMCRCSGPRVRRGMNDNQGAALTGKEGYRHLSRRMSPQKKLHRRS